MNKRFEFFNVFIRRERFISKNKKRICLGQLFNFFPSIFFTLRDIILLKKLTLIFFSQIYLLFTFFPNSTGKGCSIIKTRFLKGSLERISINCLVISGVQAAFASIDHLPVLCFPK